MLSCSFNLQELLSVFLLRTVCTSTKVNSPEQVLSSLSSGFVGATWACGSAAENVRVDRKSNLMMWFSFCSHAQVTIQIFTY